MTATPWGQAEELRSRKLPPEQRGQRELVDRDQRARLFGATVAVVASKGYEGTRVADLIEVAGISRNTFYKHFASKRDCVLATLEALEDMTERAIVEAHREASGNGEQKLAAALTALAELIAEQPAAARVGYVEVHAVGVEGLAQLDRLDARLERMVRSALRESPAYADLPPDVLRAVLGGLRGVIHTRLREEREGELPELVPGLLDWARSYRTPPQRLRRPRKVPEALTAQRPPAIDARQRILYAVTDLVGEHGYQAMAITDIADRAAVSLTTFYESFDGKQEAFLATLANTVERVLAATLPAFAPGTEWAAAVSAAARRFFGFLATEPTTAQMGGTAVWGAGPALHELRAQGVTYFSALLDEGYRQYPDTAPIAREAIAAAVDALLFGQLARRGPEHLYEVAPTAAFITLAPFVGSRRACELANAEAAAS